MNTEAFIGQVGTAMMGRLSELEQFLDRSQGGLRAEVYQRTRQLAEMLQDPNTAAPAARAVMAGMFGHNDEPQDFWRTEAGHAVASAIGYHREAVPYVTAAAILGVSRQRVYQLCEEGQLYRVPGQNAVTPSGVRQVLLSIGGRR